MEGRASTLALGMPANLVQGARASLGTPGTLMDATGNLELKFADDPDAFGTSAAYIASGKEPEGVLRSAIELAATDPKTATAQLRARKAKGAPAGDWWQEVTVAFVEMALDGVAPAANVDLGRLHTLVQMVGTVFLSGWPDDFGITVAHYRFGVNNHRTLAPTVYSKIAATSAYSGTDTDALNMRLIVEQARISFGQARQADLIALIDSTISISRIEKHLDIHAMSAKSLFPIGSINAGKVRLALAWIRTDSTAKDVRKFLDHEVVETGTGPEFSAIVHTELVSEGIPDKEILELIGRIKTGKSPAASKVRDKANVELSGDTINDAFVGVQPYAAKVLPGITNLFVRRLPHLGNNQIALVQGGDSLNVMGFVHDWAAIDFTGKLAFVHKAKITGPPL